MHSDMTIFPAHSFEMLRFHAFLIILCSFAVQRSRKLLPVLFFSPGGAFRRDSGGDNLNGPDFLVEQNIIVVTISYRLGVFGFLSLNTPLYSGNMALKDQQLALKWVHSNIVRFGGDDTRITLGGFSAGKLYPNSNMFFLIAEFSTRI